MAARVTVQRVWSVTPLTRSMRVGTGVSSTLTGTRECCRFRRTRAKTGPSGGWKYGHDPRAAGEWSPATTTSGRPRQSFHKNRNLGSSASCRPDFPAHLSEDYPRVRCHASLPLRRPPRSTIDSAWGGPRCRGGRTGRATGPGGGRTAPAVKRPSDLVTRRMTELAYRTGVRLKLSPCFDASTIPVRSRGLSVARSSVSDDKQDNGLSLGSAECGETFDERHGWGHGSSTGS